MTLPDPCPNPPRGYLDAVAGQPLLPVAAQALQVAAASSWADPARLHHEGRKAGLLLDAARDSIAKFLQVRAEDVYFAASAPTAMQAAIQGVFNHRRSVSARILVGQVESMAVLSAASNCSDAEVITIPAEHTGKVDQVAFISELADGAALACLQVANAEVGTRQPVAAIGPVARSLGIPLIVDATQVIGHDPLPEEWDVLVASARDWGGPNGVGILAVRPTVRWRPELTPDRGWVGGFPDIAAAAAAATALEYLAATWPDEAARHRKLIEHLRSELPNTAEGIELAGDPVDRLPHILTFTCSGIAGEALVVELDRVGLAVASGSACTADNRMPSHVLEAMGMAHDASVRVSLPLGCTQESVDEFLQAMPGAVERVREHFRT
jgi:cysteine desulfurase